MPQMIDFNRYSPFRRPDWRFERVLQMVDRPDRSRGRSTRRDDEYVRKLRWFLARYRNADDAARNTLAWESGGLYWSYKIHEQRSDPIGRRKAIMLESRILARQTDDEIAKELCTIPDVVELYEALFFNVRDRIHSHDWILDHVLMPAIMGEADQLSPPTTQTPAPADGTPPVAGQVREPVPEIALPYFDATLKFFAFYGGSVLLDHVMTGFRRGHFVANAEEVSKWLEDNFVTRMQLRSTAALHTCKINRYNVMGLFDAHARIMEIRKAGQLAAESFTTMQKAIRSSLEAMPFATGDQGESNIKGTPLEVYDNSAGELRDHETLLLSSGGNPGTIDGVENMQLPPARKLAKGQEDQAHASNAK